MPELPLDQIDGYALAHEIGGVAVRLGRRSGFFEVR
jgi:hypothetical protein